MKTGKQSLIGEFIKRRRLELNGGKNGGRGEWTRSAVATRAGIRDAHLYEIEEGKIMSPTTEVWAKIAKAHGLTLDALLREAGYIAHKTMNKRTIQVPIQYAASANSFAPVKKTKKKILEIDWDLIKDDTAYAVEIKGDCMLGVGIHSGDIVVISPNTPVHDGDIVLAEKGVKKMIKKYYKKDNIIVLLPCNNRYDPTIIDIKKDRDVRILGRIVKAIKPL